MTIGKFDLEFTGHAAALLGIADKISAGGLGEKALCNLGIAAASQAALLTDAVERLVKSEVAEKAPVMLGEASAAAFRQLGLSPTQCWQLRLLDPTPVYALVLGAVRGSGCELLQKTTRKWMMTEWDHLMGARAELFAGRGADPVSAMPPCATTAVAESGALHAARLAADERFLDLLEDASISTVLYRAEQAANPTEAQCLSEQLGWRLYRAKRDDENDTGRRLRGIEAAAAALVRTGVSAMAAYGESGFAFVREAVNDKVEEVRRMEEFLGGEGPRLFEVNNAGLYAAA